MPPAGLWSPELRRLLLSCDAVICNLECCISERGRPTTRIPGKRFFFRAPPAATESLRAIGVTVAGLANNHALDFGPEALLDTLKHLHGAGIHVCGAGPEQGRARASAIVDLGDARLGVVAVSDHPSEFAAGEDSPGIAHAALAHGAPAWLLAELARLRQRCEVIIAFLHWGPNMTAGPSRWQRTLAQELLEAGANAVAGHSSHVFHGIGLRPRGPCLYDLGDALDDYAVDPTLRNDRGICVIWRPGAAREVELIGLRLHLAHTEIANGEDAEWIAARVASACRELGTQVRRTGEARFDLSSS